MRPPGSPGLGREALLAIEERSSVACVGLYSVVSVPRAGFKEARVG